jgi:eukaryotic-like serine/threonine-protein kinase
LRKNKEGVSWFCAGLTLLVEQFFYLPGLQMDKPEFSLVDRILLEIQKSGDFPAMARSIGMINMLAASEAASASMLANSILQDYGLTQKLLRLANTAGYTQRDEVTTISRAVLLMGFERIRQVAAGLMLFEHLRQIAQRSDLIDAMNRSFYSAVLARKIADETGFADGEEVFISSLFHKLGRILVTFYLPNEIAAIKAMPEMDEDKAVRTLLGISYESIGIAVAEKLNMPGKITQSIPRMSPPGPREEIHADDRIRCLATLTNDITDVLASSGEIRKKRTEIERLMSAYRTHLPSVQGQLDDLITGAATLLTESAFAFNLDLRASKFARGLGEWNSAAVQPVAAAPASVDVSSAGVLISSSESADSEIPSPEEILTKGLHEITSLLVASYDLDDVLRVLLETIYRALGIGRTRVFFLLKDPSAPLARFRFGFGKSVSESKLGFDVPIREANDIFSLSMRQQKDIVIKDLNDPGVSGLLPPWYQDKGIIDRFLILLPLVLNNVSVGMIYVDGAAEGVAVLTPAVLNYLKVLRGQAVLAIKQKAAHRSSRQT